MPPLLPWVWWARLDPAPKVFLIIVTAALPIFMCCGGLAAVGVLADDPRDDGVSAQSTAAAETRPTATATPEPTATASTSPTIEIRTVTEIEEIPFTEETVEDPSLPKDTREVRTEGVAGEKTRPSVPTTRWSPRSVLDRWVPTGARTTSR